MKSTLLLTVTTATLLAASSAMASTNTKCPRGNDRPETDEVHEVTCPSCPESDRAPQVEEVLLQEGEMDEERDGRRGQRGERGERGQRGDRGERGERGDRQDGEARGGQRGGNPARALLRGIELSEEQREQVQGIMQANQEDGRAIMMAAREAHQNGDEVDREAIQAQMQELREGLIGEVRGILGEDQAAAFDENVATHQERMEGRGEGRGDRPGGDRGQRDAGPLLQGIELSEEQREEVQGIMQANREAGREIMMAAREAHENGDEVDREAIHAQLQGLREAGAAGIRGVLNEEQTAQFDENQAALQERMEEGRGQGRGRGPGGQGDGADRPRGQRGGDRPGGGRGRGGDRPQGGGEGQLDLG